MKFLDQLLSIDILLLIRNCILGIREIRIFLYNNFHEITAVTDIHHLKAYEIRNNQEPVTFNVNEDILI
ncbi:hypothetical protein BpHYR1_020239 [Brachionus plicatilis]|uniref:Uncharacterized protein n=1 Tax=Brachionus plicatilis TaxID=10195 RepID=A0A3M7R4U8_BRAPC|nr:hypothetical protein BpHYR1_020239 [Brachionus plicatilis]